ncbi:MAG: hypothetical protein WBA74_15960 [Cyclobacteriaceae bacterium]
MLKKLIILTLTILCLTGLNSFLYAQDGNPQVFGKKNIQTENDAVEDESQDPEPTVQESDEPGSFLPQKQVKVPVDAPLSRPKSVNLQDSTQINTNGKEKEPKNKYNILFYYFYKSKHEENEEKDKDVSDNS